MQTLEVRRLLLALATAFAFVGCDLDEAQVATEGNGRAPIGEVELDRATIAAQEQIWLAARPAAYSYVVETQCDCFLAGTYTVTVAGQEVIAAEPHNVDAEPFLMYSPPTLDGAFAMLDEPLALVEAGEMSSGEASAAFDPVFGYPTRFSVDGEALPAYQVEIRDFTPVDAAAIDRPPPGLQLTISNQSFDHPDVSLTVIVNDEVLIERSFPVENQHAHFGYRLPLEPGDYELIVRADTGASHEQVLTLGSERRYLYVGYVGGTAATPEAFSIQESDQPFVFG